MQLESKKRLVRRKQAILFSNSGPMVIKRKDLPLRSVGNDLHRIRAFPRSFEANRLSLTRPKKESLGGV